MSAATTLTTETTSTDLLAPATTGLETSTVESLRALFVPFLDRAREWEKRAGEIVVTDVSQTREMKFARESRLALREIRCAVENARKQSKADALSRGRAIDGIANAIKGVIEPIEAHLLEQETFAERAETARKGALRTAREEALRAYGADPSIYANLGETTEEAWASALDGARAAHEAKLEAARQAEAVRVEAERLAAEAKAKARAESVRLEAERIERERVQAEENVRLKREAEEREAAARVEREAAAAALAATEAKAKAEREAAAEETRKAREETDRAARELAKAQAAAAQAKADAERATLERQEAERAHAAAARAIVEAEAAYREGAEAARLASEESARKAAELAPDREKLAAFAATLRSLPVPTLSTARGQAAGTKVAEQIAKMVAWIEKTGASL